MATELRPMLAGLTDRLPVGRGWRYEPKWDGFRCLAAVDRSGRVILSSRRGTDLTLAFPDVAAAVANVLPAGTLVDGELVRWGADGRLDFEALQRRNRSAGRGARELARTEPCHLIVFDVLATAEHGDTTGRPLTERRELLERLLADAESTEPAVVLGMQTDDVEVAEMWLEALGKVGVEGIVAKRPTGHYRPGARGWSKIKNYATTDVIIGGVTGPIERPESLVVGRIHRDDGRLHLAGRTTDLNPAAAEQVARMIEVAGAEHPWP
ncbi:MAG TPA: ATP-dependent DNA ligase, partial [Microlunatus sp.]|nr:ATP-dependent DNA ligase [Microlunatus sp.]